MSAKKKKSLFDRAIDALTDRDERQAAAAQAKAAADAAKNEVAARARIAAEQAAADQTAVEKAAAERRDAPQVASDRMEPKSISVPQTGTVIVRSLRVRRDHSTSSEVVGGLVNGNRVTILETWSNGRETWGRLENGWAAMVYNRETYIKFE